MKNKRQFVITILIIWAGLFICGCSLTEQFSFNTDSNHETQVLNEPREENFDPQGYSGAKWNMTYDQVKSIVGPGISTDDGGYLQTQDVYGRKAHVNYLYHEEQLDIIVITFFESYDKNQTDLLVRKDLYSETQNALAYDYGVFIVLNEEDKIINNLVSLQSTSIEHFLSYKTVSDITYLAEQIVIFQNT